MNYQEIETLEINKILVMNNILNTDLKMKRILYILIISFLISCGEQEVATYDANGESTLVSFGSIESNLEVVIDATGSVDIPVFVSTYASNERTITVEVLSEGAEDEASVDQYSFDANVVIPPNTLNTTFEVRGIDAGIEVGDVLTLKLKITDTDFANASIEDRIHTVSISQVCPIPEDYLVGTYVLTSPNANIWCNDPRPSFIGDGVEVNVTLGSTSTTRVFEAKYAPGSCEGFNGPYQFTVSLACGVSALANRVTTNVWCGAEPFIAIVNDPSRVSNYDIDDDSTLTINVIEDVDGSCTNCCGAPFTNQSFTLTKK